MNNILPVPALMEIGFTETEAAIYCELLRGPPATGYRLAKAIGKGPANVYQALADLAQKGAVMVSEGDAKTYRATPPADLLSGLRRAFDGAQREAQAALEALHAESSDDRIYQLKNPAQIYERADAMIAGAREILLFDIFPEPLDRLMPALVQAHARGVTVAGMAYRDPPPAPFPIAPARSSGMVAERWPGLQLSLVADARQHLVALLSSDGGAALHGVWSDSAYLACLQHSGLASEIQICAAQPPLDEALSRLSLLSAYPSGLVGLIGPKAPREEARS